MDEPRPTEFDQVARLDASKVIAAIDAAGGPILELVGPLHGAVVGAVLVRRSDGTELVLTAAPARPPGVPAGAFDTARELMALARAHGVPAPRYTDVIELPDGGVAVLQERVPGVAVHAVSAALVDRMIELAEVRRGLVAETSYATVPCPLYLTSSGPGFCHHEPMHRFNVTTRRVLERIDAIGNSFLGTDLLHFDYHFGNVLVAEDDPDEVTGIVDWNGARAGDLALDLALLRFDLSWRNPAEGQRLELQLVETTDAPTFLKAWAHSSLRLVDWVIRHHPNDVPHWVTLATTYLQ